MSNDLTKNDGFNIEAEDRLIRGELLKFSEGRWTVDGEAVGGEQRFMVLGTAQAVQRWADGKPVETLTAKPLPDVNALNDAVPQEEWEEGLNGPRPPWQCQHALYLVCPADGSSFTYISGTVGGRIAIEGLVDRVATMRRLRGCDVLPLIALGAKSMKTKFGQRLRPEFVVDGWRQIGNETKTIAPPTIAEELNDAVHF
jgi:hypothetical protein